MCKETVSGEHVRHEASFRDPSGFIFRRDGDLLREVSFKYQENYELLMSSGLYDTLLKHHYLVSHTEVDQSLSMSGDSYKVIKPTYIPFISYPYEWCFSQLKDAAILTLHIQKLALEKGMVLKDASAYNVQFYNGRPIFIDTLSFEKYEVSQPWVAYLQFCQHFLAPLALMAHVDVSLIRLSLLHVDGVPLELASALLPWKTKFSPTLGVHIHAHSKYQTKYAHAREGGESSKKGFTQRKMDMLIAGLEMGINQLKWKGGGTEWDDYYESTHNYGNQGLDKKAEVVQSLIEQVSPQKVWDLGANDGRFSRVAAKKGAYAIAWDIDPSCIERNYLQIKREGDKRVLPLFLDLTNPSPGMGWANVERQSLGDRGPVDLIMALGLIHHLVISNNVPLAHCARYFESLCQYLIIEFIPKEDSQIQLLLATRDDIFGDYQLSEFRSIFSDYFEVCAEVPIENTCRVLFLLKSKQR